MSYGADEPSVMSAIPQSERDRRVELSEEQCIIDGKDFFVRGCLELPMVGDGSDVFVWGVWVSLSEQNFEQMHLLWNSAERASEPPYFGWLCTALPCYPDTMYLKTNVHTRAVGVRPLVRLQPSDHPLFLEQENGITIQRVQEFAEQILHP